MKERLLNRPRTADPAPLGHRGLTSLRPNSAAGISEKPPSLIRRVSGGERPKSGKSTTFSFVGDEGGERVGGGIAGDGRWRLGSSVSVGRPVTGTSLASYRTEKSRLTSAHSTRLASSREGARSPTPNALRDMEPAFFEVHMCRSTFTAWRVEKSTLQILDTNEIGFFHESNAYLLLHINEDDVKSLHYWMGEHCSKRDEAHVETKAHELDKILCHADLFTREVQNHESVIFMSLFRDGIVYIEGKHRTSVTIATSYDKRMYQVTGRKYARAACVIPRKELLQSDSALILDGFPRIYVWLGAKCGYVKRVRAIHLAKKIREHQRKGKCHIVIIDEKDVGLNEAFRKKLDNGIPFPGAGLVSNGVLPVTENVHDASILSLHRVSGDHVLYDMPEASKSPLKHRYLVKGDSYLLDRGSTAAMYVWVGSQAMENEVQNALQRGKAFSEHRAYCRKSSVCRISENNEPPEFKQCFCDWRDRLTRDKPLTKCYHVGSVGRALFSRSDQRTVAKLNECWSDDILTDGGGSSEVWLVTEAGLESWKHPGIFNNNSCYLLLHRTTYLAVPYIVLYYWMGSKSPVETKEKAVQLALKKDEELHHTTVIVRVLDGKEPQHFMTLMHNWIMVYDSDGSNRPKTEIQMYSVREFSQDSVRVQQVLPRWSSLNSSASFVLTTPSSSYLWYGKESGSQERESTKELLALLCSSKMYSYDIVTEEKEPSAFHQILGPREEYAKEFSRKMYEKRPPRLVCCQWQETTPEFTDISHFTQEDISEEDVMLLDIFDQLFVWCGERVSEDERQKLPALAQAFMEQDPARRQIDDLVLWFVTQRHEPEAFSKHFPTWSALGYMGSSKYEAIRKFTRQENAKVDVDESMVDISHFGQPKYPYKTLLKKELPSDVDDTHKELHLTDRQFRENLRLTRDQFYRLPQWKQRQILRSTRLFYTPPLPRHTIDLTEDDYDYNTISSLHTRHQ